MLSLTPEPVEWIEAYIDAGHDSSVRPQSLFQNWERFSERTQSEIRELLNAEERRREKARAKEESRVQAREELKESKMKLRERLEELRTEEQEIEESLKELDEQ